MGVKWRHLTLAEYRKVAYQSAADPVKWCDVYETCLMTGPPLQDAPAGIVAWIGQTELASNPFSGKFEPLVQSLAAARKKVVSSYLLCAQAVVASTFRYTLEEVESWPPEVFFERVAQAEQLTGVPLNPADPSKPAAPPTPQPQGKRQQRQGRRPVQREEPNVNIEEQATFRRR